MYSRFGYWSARAAGSVWVHDAHNIHFCLTCHVQSLDDSVGNRVREKYSVYFSMPSYYELCCQRLKRLNSTLRIPDKPPVSPGSRRISWKADTAVQKWIPDLNYLVNVFLSEVFNSSGTIFCVVYALLTKYVCSAQILCTASPSGGLSSR